MNAPRDRRQRALRQVLLGTALAGCLAAGAAAQTAAPAGPATAPAPAGGGGPSPPVRTFVPSETITADTSVSFPVDI